LIEHTATVEQQANELENRFFFSGQRNFYEGVDVCWRQTVRVRLLDGQQQQNDLDAEEWKLMWREALAKWNKVVWNGRPDTSVPMHRHTPVDYALDHRPGNLAVESGPGPNGGNAGFALQELPTPREPEVPPSNPAGPAEEAGNELWRFSFPP
jgi:hypothetical protein